MNIPNLLFRLLGERGEAFAQWLPRSILGYGIDDLFFLSGVILLWYIAGRALDRRRSRAARIGAVTALIIYPLLLLLAAALAPSGLYDLGPGRVRNLDPPIGAFLRLMWSIALVVIAGLGSVMAIRAWKHNDNG
jgi:hypothetical protein